MTTTRQVSANTSYSVGNTIKTHWLNPRRKRFWALILILLYTLLGFFAAPLIVRNSLTALIQDDLGRPTHIENIEVNPYVLSLRVQGFQVTDTDGVKLVAFDELFINFQFLSVLKWAWTFSEIHLTGPYFYFERFDSGESRLDHLLADFAKTQPVETGPDTSVEQADSVPRLLIRNLELKGGHVDVRDNVPETPVELQLSPINISIQELNTLPDLHGQKSVTIHLPDNASLKWSGSLALVPLETRGELILEGLQLNPVIAYLESVLPLESLSATLSSRFQYHLRQDNSGEFKLDINELGITLDDLLVSGLTPATEFVDIPGISLQGGKLRYPEQSLYFSKLSIDRPQLTAWVNEDGNFSLLDLLPETAEQPRPADIDSTTLPWRLGLGEFILDNGSLALTDLNVQPTAHANLANLRVRLTDISNADGVQMPLELSGRFAEGGNYALNGKLGILPELSLSASASTKDIPLSLGQPYVGQFAHITIEAGKFNSTIELNLSSPGDITLDGSIQAPGLVVNDALKNNKLLSWGVLDIDYFDFTDKGLQLSQLVFEQPFGSFIINEDMTTNLTALVVEQESDSAGDTGPGASPDPVRVSIGGIRVDDGSMDFADFSLPLPFATHIINLDGNISTIDTSSIEPANIRLEGQVDEYGLARIEGSMNMLDPIRHTDVTIEFRNLLMSTLSPYTAAFAGRQIDQGKLDLGLVYSIQNGQLLGENEVVLSDLVLGDKVDHPDAASLPLGLAVSLLKDADGVINLNLPVEGDINDPEFKIGGVVWQAFKGLITKIVSAPFKLLGKLIGVDSEDFGQFEFLAGRADLTPPELEKIVQLEEALQKRPELTIEISGVTDHVVDIPALKSIRLRQAASERLDAGLGDQRDANLLLNEEIRKVVEALFRERFPDIPPQDLKADHTAPPADDPEGKPVVDELAWATDLWNRLLASEVVGDQDLTELATARAEAIRAAFLASGQIDAGRIVIAEPKQVESGNGEWVKLELAVATG